MTEMPDDFTPDADVPAQQILFVHDRGAGQFGALGHYLARRGWPVTFAASRTVDVPGAASLVYGPHRGPSERTHPYAQSFDRAALNAQGFARAALAAAKGGLAPDIVVSHAGPGAGLLAREVFPKARTVAYAEWWHNHPAPDLAWLGQSAGPGLSDSEQAMVERTRNAAMALEIASADAAICPTAFQAGQFPRALQPAITIHHDGIDTDLYAPARTAGADAACPAPLRGLAPGTPLVTYATRGMEPHRGFPQFMAALPAIQAAHPDAVIAIAGENRVAYGTDAMRATDWLEQGLATPGPDQSRVVLLGMLPGSSYRWLLRRSDARVYLTVPFVLSWSMLEAMSMACPLVLSDTEPVREFAGGITQSSPTCAIPPPSRKPWRERFATPWPPATAARRRGVPSSAASRRPRFMRPRRIFCGTSSAGSSAPERALCNSPTLAAVLSSPGIEPKPPASRPITPALRFCA